MPPFVAFLGPDGGCNRLRDTCQGPEKHYWTIMFTRNKPWQAFNLIVEQGIEGLPPLKSSQALAQDILEDSSYTGHEHRVRALIARESRKNAYITAITNLGGLVTLPISIPANVYASFAYQARLAAAVAQIYGHDVQAPKVRTLVGLSLAGRRAVDILKAMGVKFTSMVLERCAMQLTDKVLADVGTAVGVRVLAQSGQQLSGILMKSIPLAGAAVCGVIDWRYCRAVGNVASEMFRRQ